MVQVRIVGWQQRTSEQNLRDMPAGDLLRLLRLLGLPELERDAAAGYPVARADGIEHEVEILRSVRDGDRR